VNVNDDVVAAVLRTHSDARRATTLVDLAKIEFEAGDYERALDRFEQSLVENPGDGEVWGLAAITTLRVAEERDDDDIATARIKANRCVERAKEAGASGAFLESLRAHVDSHLIRRAIGNVRRAQVRYVPGVTPRQVAMMDMRLIGTIKAAQNVIVGGSASDDVRFDAAFTLRDLTLDLARHISGSRVLLRELHEFLSRLAAGNEARTTRLAEARRRQMVLPGALMVGGLFVGLVLLALLLSLVVS